MTCLFPPADRELPTVQILGREITQQFTVIKHGQIRTPLSIQPSTKSTMGSIGGSQQPHRNLTMSILEVAGSQQKSPEHSIKSRLEAAVDLKRLDGILRSW